MKSVVAAFNQEKALRTDLLFKLYWTVKPGHEQISGPLPVCGTGLGLESGYGGYGRSPAGGQYINDR